MTRVPFSSSPPSERRRDDKRARYSRSRYNIIPGPYIYMAGYNTNACLECMYNVRVVTTTSVYR